MLNHIRERRLPTAAYPFRGFLHLLHNPKRHAGPIAISVAKVAATSLVAVIPLFRYGYGIQSDLIQTIYTHIKPDNDGLIRPLVAITGGLLCIVESFAITLQLGNYFIGSVRKRLFDSVLRERGGYPPTFTEEKDAVVDSRVSVIAEKIGGPAEGPLRHHRFLSPYNIMILSAQQDESWSIYFLRAGVFLFTLPLNIIPVVGPACFLSIQALFRAGEAHKRYFQVYNWSMAQRQRRIEENFWQYQRFGLVSTALEMIPFAGFVFMYTNHIGAAIWAMDLHDRKLLEPKLE
ncbi:hypothetical protein K501DRAFT_241455 [Backusella circina FSU 941]|nr:hypothetical protein K501DRAFT_241455 [Backusella circina FSU 941]